jgi:hypothetical protein
MDIEDAFLAIVDIAEARNEVERHGADWSEFQEAYGKHAEYHGKDVLEWLGY